MRAYFLSLGILVFLFFNFNSCTNTNKDEEDEKYLNALSKTEVIPNQDLLWIPQKNGIDYNKLLNGLKDTLIKDANGNDVKVFPDYGYCLCDSSLVFLEVNPAVDYNTRRKVAKSKVENDGAAFGSYGQNLQFRVGPLNPIGPTDPSGPGTFVPSPYDNNDPNIVEVAVIDTGVDIGHPSLQDNHWIPRPVSGNNCVGITAVGVDFTLKNPNLSPIDFIGHGTHVSGILSHDMSPDSLKIMSLKITRDSMTNLFDALCATKFAIKQNVDIINMSWGYYAKNYDTIFYNIIKGAPDILFVTSAGNDSLDTDKYPHWPSGFSNTNGIDNVISVAALNNTKKDQAGFSNYGSSSIDLMAPGTNIKSAFLNNDCKVWSGTSMAAPYVSREAAILKARNHHANGRQLKLLIYGVLSNIQTNNANNVKSGKKLTGKSIVCN